MAGLAADARGRFVCAEYNAWEAYQRRGEDVPGGQNFSIYVLAGTEQAPLLVKIWTATEDIERARAACAGLKFGDQVHFLVQPGASKSYRFLDRMPDAVAAKS